MLSLLKHRDKQLVRPLPFDSAPTVRLKKKKISGSRHPFRWFDRKGGSDRSRASQRKKETGKNKTGKTSGENLIYFIELYGERVDSVSE